MRPLKLLMKGFGAFRDQTDIDLTDIDLMALVGPTGSGKSTIIDAITFALYGTVARYEDNRLVAPVINQTSTEARVLLEFELSDQIYTAIRVVRRTRGGGATTKEARLERGDEVLAGDARAMSEQAEALLGLGVEQFNRTVVLPQGKFAAFLHDKPRDRQATLVQLLGLQLYQRIGQRARQKSAVAVHQIDALQPEYDSRADRLNDERGAALADRVANLEQATSRLNDDRAAIDALDREMAGLQSDLQSLDAQIDGLSKISVPADLEAFAEQITSASAAKAEADKLRWEQAARRRRAEQAVAAGPDLVAVELQMRKHRDLAKITLDYDRVVPKHHQAAVRHQAASVEAARLEQIQEELQVKVEQARQAEAQARAARDASATVIQVDAWESSHGHYRAAVKELETAQGCVQAAEEAIPPLRKALRSAVSAAEGASARLEELRRRAGVLGHLDLLEVGQDCPLCLQEVGKPPVHTFDDADLRRAEEDKRLAEAFCSQAQEACKEANTELKGRTAQADAALRSVHRYRSEIASIPSYEQLNGLREEATRLAEGVRVAGEAIGQAEAAAREHRESPTYSAAIQTRRISFEQATRLDAKRDALSQQLAELGEEVATLPSESQLLAQIEEAKRLRQQLQAADSQLQDVEARAESTAARLNELAEQRRVVAAALNDARDRVARYRPPPVDPSDLLAAWTSLADWANQQRESAEGRRGAAVEQLTNREDQRAAVMGRLRVLCEELLGPTDSRADVSELGIGLAEALAAAKTQKERFDRDREDLKDLKKRIEKLTEQAQVARKLGALLRADGFESWLMEAALDQLVERATESLYELSNGQYSLEVHRREFYVRDHTNADELRPARTLSGGETFLASLSLSLALADTTADLSTGTVSVMESIFLDEGFGTLDRHTLETVATAVEELGAGGRLVGVVTHIRELADRMPVRLELTKTGGVATVQRIDL